jgi:hypothetical protein
VLNSDVPALLMVSSMEVSEIPSADDWTRLKANTLPDDASIPARSKSLTFGSTAKPFAPNVVSRTPAVVKRAMNPSGLLLFKLNPVPAT